MQYTETFGQDIIKELIITVNHGYYTQRVIDEPFNLCGMVGIPSLSNMRAQVEEYVNWIYSRDKPQIQCSVPHKLIFHYKTPICIEYPGGVYNVDEIDTMTGTLYTGEILSPDVVAILNRL
jgi:hypothetical protein